MSNRADHTDMPDVPVHVLDLRVICSQCGITIAALSRFCSKCGSPLQQNQSANFAPMYPAHPNLVPATPGPSSGASNRVAIPIFVTLGILLAAGVGFVLFASGSQSVQLTPEDLAGTRIVFNCPSDGCEVTTDVESMAVLILHRTDTPGDNGLIDSATRTKGYFDALRNGKIISIQSGTHGIRRYRTAPSEYTPTRYSVVKLLDGIYAGSGVIATDEGLWPDNSKK